MPGKTDKKENLKLGPLNLLVLVLSLYVLGALVADTAYELPPETSRLLKYIDNAICVVFFSISVSGFTVPKIKQNLCAGAGSTLYPVFPWSIS